MENEVIKVLKKFKCSGINYFIIRDFKNIDDIVNSADIDIYIEYNYKKEVDCLLNKMGWFTPILNNNKFPHKQYYKICGDKIYKFDIVYGFFYGKEMYELNIKNICNDLFTREKNEVFIAKEEVALITMLLHIIFDKKSISEKNLKILIDMYSDYKNSKRKLKSEYFKIEEIIKEITNQNKDETNIKINVYNKEILKLNIIKKHIIKARLINSIKFIIGKCLKIKKILSKNSIAFIGVDGVGKSSFIIALQKIYGDKAEVVYMGENKYNLKILEKKMKKESDSIIGKINKRILIILEMLIRYFKLRFTDKVIIFDRYVDDIFINSKGVFRILDIIVYKLLFPKPKIKIYLYCELTTSFKRKDDIIDKSKFEKMKTRYDSYFLNINKSINLCTDNIPMEQNISIIVENINSKLPFSLV